jgi:hypothetical protein
VRFATDLDTELLGFRHRDIHVEMDDGRFRVHLGREGVFTLLEWRMPPVGNRSRDYLDAILARVRMARD